MRADTHRHTTHHASMAQIWYAHHPCCGQPVEMVRWGRRQTSASRVVKRPDGVQSAMASWRLDPLACRQLHDAPAPRFSVEARLALRDVLDHARLLHPTAPATSWA
jgi:hypothetical protein